MNTVGHYIEAVRNYAEDPSGKPQVTYAIPPRMAYFYLMVQVNSLKFQFEQNTKRDLDKTNPTVYIECQDICEVPISDCPNGPTDCTWYMLEKPLPKFHGVMLDHVYISYSGGWNEINYRNLKEFGNREKSFRKWISNASGYTIKNKGSESYLMLQFEDDRMPDKISFGGKWPDPIELTEWLDESEEICDLTELPWDISPEYEALAIQRTYDMITSLMRRMGEGDNIADDVDGSHKPREQLTT